MLVTNKKTQVYKEHVISFIDFAFGEGVTITYWTAKMKLYVSGIEESYKDTIIGLLENSGTKNLLLYKVQCLCACVVDEEKRALPMVLYCSGMMYKYYSRIIFSQ